MGYKTEISVPGKYEFNWVLKLKPFQGFPDILEAGREYEFTKVIDEGLIGRIYPIGNLIDLINENWEAVAKVCVLELHGEGEIMAGKYRVEYLFNQDEKMAITNYWRKSFAYLLGKKIEEIDWKNFKAS